MNNETIIKLTNDQIIVLWELLFRINSKNLLKDFFEDQSEQRVLWDLEWILEKNTSTILSENYITSLKKARENIKDKD